MTILTRVLRSFFISNGIRFGLYFFISLALFGGLPIGVRAATVASQEDASGALSQYWQSDGSTGTYLVTSPVSGKPGYLLGPLVNATTTVAAIHVKMQITTTAGSNVSHLGNGLLAILYGDDGSGQACGSGGDSGPYEDPALSQPFSDSALSSLVDVYFKCNANIKLSSIIPGKPYRLYIYPAIAMQSTLVAMNVDGSKPFYEISDNGVFTDKVPVITGTAPFSDSFDTYALNNNLYTQGLWHNNEHAWQVSNAGCFDGQCISSTDVGGSNWKSGTDMATGEWHMHFFVNSAFGSNGGSANISFGSAELPQQSSLTMSDDQNATIKILDARGTTVASNLAMGAWHTLDYAWDMTNPNDCEFTVRVDDGAPVLTNPSFGGPTNCYGDVYTQHVIGSLSLGNEHVLPGQVIFDDIGDGPIVSGCFFNCDGSVSPSLSNLFDVASSTNSWVTQPSYNPGQSLPFAFDDGNDGSCHSGGCLVAQGSSGGFGTLSQWSDSYYETGVPRSAGAITLWGKATIGFFGVGDTVSLCTLWSDCAGSYKYSFDSIIPKDNTWHQLYLAWRQGTTSVEFCTLVDDTKSADCNWQSSLLTPGMQIDGIELYAYNSRPDLGDHVWFDDLQDVSDAKPTPIAVPPAIANLAQTPVGGTALSEGTTFLGNSVTFSATSTSTNPLKLEVELKPAATPFNGTGTLFSATTTSATLSVTVNELIPLAQQYVAGGNVQAFHWRARVADTTTGLASNWQNFGTASSTDFTAKVVPLWTQVQSNYPGASENWATQTYASGIDHICGNKSNGYTATVGSCGCLITSFVMLSHYYAVEKGVDGSDITPLTVNNWLEAHKGYVDVTHDGIVSENLLDYNAMQRYLGTIQNGKSYSWFAYKTVPKTNKIKITDVATIDGLLSSLQPAILYNKAVGHYFVATQKLPTGTYAINDPYFYNTKTLHDPTDSANHVHNYNDTFAYAIVPQKLSTVTPVVAYETLYLASPAEFLVVDPQGHREGKDPRTNTTYDEISGASYDLSDPIATDQGVDATTLPQTKVLTLPALTNGTYTVEVIGTGTGTYQFTTTLSDSAGSTTAKIINASTTPGAVTTYIVTPSTKTVTLDAGTLIDSIITTIKNAKLKLVGDALLLEMQAIKVGYQKHTAGAKLLVGATYLEVKQMRGKQIPAATADTLLSELSDLQQAI